MKEENNKYFELIILYRNYIFALQEHEEYGDIYGDTDELIEMYKKKLEKVIKKERGK